MVPIGFVSDCVEPKTTKNKVIRRAGKRAFVRVKLDKTEKDNPVWRAYNGFSAKARTQADTVFPDDTAGYTTAISGTVIASFVTAPQIAPADDSRIHLADRVGPEEQPDDHISESDSNTTESQASDESAESSHTMTPSLVDPLDDQWFESLRNRDWTDTIRTHENE
ncbi:hypothetical protein VTN77DRAFT_3112 [Rasamsonia byssochlamydoides]|uniref:uncharacterized protein n=1 Tax=Rasamsonia byssochlamydoides TaxID=89139 RepID=UPI0037432BFC